MQVYRFTFTVDDTIKAESLVEAWSVIKDRIDDRYYGPTIANLEFVEETVETEEAEKVS